MKIENDGNPVCTGNSYGYGLRISLTEDQVEALGLKSNPPAAGSVVGLQCIATVVSVEQRADDTAMGGDGDGDGVDVSLSFQITDMEVTPTRTMADMARALYGND